ncbi:glycerol-3-phosphate acyltransferase [Candidatus Thorarchaeota archaeon]|nr:MAG: glycerol-3-phosphate acyltransferase [Candidatus Thorarchaeota archaeon]
MMVWLEVALASVVGYLLGSISFSALSVKLFASEEQKAKIAHPAAQVEGQEAEPMYGAFTANRIWGAKAGFTISLLDMLKVALPMWIFKVLLYPGEYYYLVVSIAGVFGHNWPVFFRFKGGRGASATLASFFVIDWLGPIGVMVLGAVLGLMVIRDAGLTYLSFTVLMFPWLWFRTFDPVLLLWVIGVDIALYASIVPDIRAVRTIEGEQGKEVADASLDDLTPGTRGMRRVTDRINALGGAKYGVALLGIIILAVAFWYLPLLPF